MCSLQGWSCFTRGCSNRKHLSLFYGHGLSHWSDASFFFPFLSLLASYSSVCQLFTVYSKCPSSISRTEISHDTIQYADILKLSIYRDVCWFPSSSEWMGTEWVSSSELWDSQFSQAGNVCVLPYPICNAIVTWLNCSFHYKPHFPGFVAHP